MLDWVHESWLSVAATAAGIVVMLTVGRRTGRPASVATAAAAVALAGGMLGMALGLRKVDHAFQTTTGFDLALRVKILSVGTREASDNLLVGGACAVLLVLAGSFLAAYGARKE